MARLSTTVGPAVGAASTMGVRALFDQSGDSSITRPSVLYGVGTGSLSLGLGWAINRDMISAPVGGQMFTEAMMSYGATALTAGLISAVTPKGTGGFQTPSLPA